MARKEPAPISLKKDRSEPAVKVVTPVEPFNKDAPEHRPRIVKRIVKDKALEARVTSLEGAETVQPIVKIEMPPRPRIVNVRIKYDNFNNPVDLVPTYE